MKNHLFILLFFSFLTSCSKKDSLMESRTATSHTSSVASNYTYQQYLIPKGQQYCKQSGFQEINSAGLSFKVKFDSSAIYKNLLAKNQNDINKLYGFSDNKALHHEYSARFGWRWSNNALHLFAYVYNASVLSFKEIGSVEIGMENNCSITVKEDNYIFRLNTTEVIMPRKATTANAEGYKLYPYFGGDETSPHDISIWIMEVSSSK